MRTKEETSKGCNGNPVKNVSIRFLCEQRKKRFGMRGWSRGTSFNPLPLRTKEETVSKAFPEMPEKVSIRFLCEQRKKLRPSTTKP
ncbi:hypothetical protein LEP1GSC024_1606 [Leptospira noguchii str. 2001034031]|uniref:Uncharacterized protein n=2 Tax=Leptospira noguchii TaxID=28182 RepID=M6YCG2_9LEPT|nr:hypothetical protein LEP1GSC024_1606 [Leptospira noguchii str. 2001034031]